MALSRLRSLTDSVNMIPVRMPQACIEPASSESQGDAFDPINLLDSDVEMVGAE